jgi:hypothetical protein
VVLDRLPADVELCRHLRVGIPFANQHRHISLAVGELKEGSG